jgi:hypothetical protein
MLRPSSSVPLWPLPATPIEMPPATMRMPPRTQWRAVTIIRRAIATPVQAWPA